MPKPVESKFIFKGEKTIRRESFKLTTHQCLKLRQTLQKGIYWIQPFESGMISWNFTLLQSWLLSGDTAAHRDLVDEYLATLPQAA